MKLGLLNRIMGRRAAPLPISVDSPMAVIGDLHGCVDLLERMLDELARTAPDARLVFVGDYIDRGPHSAQVLDRLIALTNATCLMGNHERMCLDFLQAPSPHADRWIRHGGAQTLASFGLGTGPRLHDQLAEAMGADRIAWMQHRPLFWKNGTVYITHAGADPDQPVEGQDEQTLLWGAAGLARQARADGHWVVHGHTIVVRPGAEMGRITIDTGAYKTGVLTAAVFEGQGLRFVQVTRAGA